MSLQHRKFDSSFAPGATACMLRPCNSVRYGTERPNSPNSAKDVLSLTGKQAALCRPDLIPTH